MAGRSPWYLTVIRTQGLQFIRPEKSWRPIVTIVVADQNQIHETVLGSDCQNPNLKSPFVLYNVDHKTYLDIKVWHKSQTKKKSRKRHLVGSAYVSLGEILRNQGQPMAGSTEQDIRLSCPSPQKKSPTIAGRQQHNAILTIKLCPPTPMSTTSTLVGSSSSFSHHEDDAMSDAVSGALSSGTLSDTMPSPSIKETESFWHEKAAPNQLRKRRIKPFRVGSDDENSSSDESSGLPTPRDSYFPHLPAIHAAEGEGEGTGWFSTSSLPLYVDHISDRLSVHNTVSFAERILDIFSPYRELQQASLDCDYEKILARLLTEWYVVGASLLALAGIDATVFGISPAPVFSMDGFTQTVVTIGAISAGLGVVIDAWFLVLYSGASPTKFQRLAADVYGTYVFFCLTCRLPTLLMFGSALALMLFLLGVAWGAWPTAVLVMSFVAGTLVSLQYLVFGCHRFVNLLVWAVRSAWAASRAARLGLRMRWLAPVPMWWSRRILPASRDEDVFACPT
ncbi:hypothetical protein A0H81_14009 [Grifola frondosa]|uniref:C2 domain-containing protein n=1 Tax=Grifola frondosa TaxID=5627 RepID=A0A1C7LN41_GRIFR|nr:hypothetical protein A0H81_14009 [Grifola frondosa]